MQMDRRTLTAIALCILFLLFYPQLVRWAGLGRYMEPKKRAAPAETTGARPEAGAQPPAGADSNAPASPAAPTGNAGGAPDQRIRIASPAAGTAPERLIHVDTPLYDATFSTRGARLVSITLKQYAAAHVLSGKGHVHRDKNGNYPEEARVSLAGEPSFGLDRRRGPALAGARRLRGERSLDAAASAP
jgi:YidC/Oxa1 family membrane protein insertase